MLVTDNDYPRFYGLDAHSVYVVSSPTSAPVYIGLVSSRASWSCLHATEDQVAQKWCRDYPDTELVQHCLDLVARDIGANYASYRQ